MNNNELERIEAYLNESMSKEERTGFEAELAANENLSAAFALYQSIEQTMRWKEEDNANEDSLQQTLKELGEVYFTAEPVSEQKESQAVQPKQIPLNKETGSSEAEIRGPATVIHPWVKFAMAASIVGIMALGIWYFQQKDKGSGTVAVKEKPPTTTAPVTKLDTFTNKSRLDTPAPGEPSLPLTADQNNKPKQVKAYPNHTEREALYARYFQPDTIPAKRDEYLNEAFGFYEVRNYPKAIDAFDGVASAPLTRGETEEEALTIFYAQYYQALSYLAAGNTKKAIAGLRKIFINNSFLQAKAQWYLALAYIKAGQWAEADHLLSQLAQNKKARPYQQKALSLQQALDRK